MCMDCAALQNWRVGPRLGVRRPDKKLCLPQYEQVQKHPTTITGGVLTLVLTALYISLWSVVTPILV